MFEQNYKPKRADAKLLYPDFVNTDAHKFGRLYTDKDGTLDEQIAMSVASIRRLRKKHKKDANIEDDLAYEA